MIYNLRPEHIRPHDIVRLADQEPFIVQRTDTRPHVLTGEPVTSVYRASDGRLELSLYANDTVPVERLPEQCMVTAHWTGSCWWDLTCTRHPTWRKTVRGRAAAGRGMDEHVSARLPLDEPRLTVAQAVRQMAPR